MGEREHTQLNAALTTSSRIKAKEKKRCHRATQNRIIPRVPALHSRHGHTNNTTNRHRQTVIDMSTAFSQSEQNICMAGCMHARIKPVQSRAPSPSVAYLPTYLGSALAKSHGQCQRWMLRPVIILPFRDGAGQGLDSTRSLASRTGKQEGSQSSRRVRTPQTRGT